MSGDELTSGMVGRSLILEYIIAAHQHETPRILEDPLSSRVVDVRADLPAPITEHDRNSIKDQYDKYADMRLLLVMCHRYADDVLVAAMNSEIRQLVVLDAGLDMTCYRRPYPGVRLYEVNSGPVQAWKRQRLADISLPEPPTLNRVPLGADHDLGRMGVERFGYDFDEPTLVIWLDNAIFLPEHVVGDTLGWLDDHRGRVEFVFNYVQTPDTRDTRMLENLAALRMLMDVSGHPPVSYLSPARLRTRLRGCGFDDIEDLEWEDLLARYLPARIETHDPVGGHVIHATRTEALLEV